MNNAALITLTWLLVCRLMNTFSCRPRRCSARPAERPGMENGDDDDNDNDGDDHNNNDDGDHNDNDVDDHSDLMDNHWDNDHMKMIKN